MKHGLKYEDIGNAKLDFHKHTIQLGRQNAHTKCVDYFTDHQSTWSDWLVGHDHTAIIASSSSWDADVISARW